MKGGLDALFSFSSLRSILFSGLFVRPVNARHALKKSNHAYIIGIYAEMFVRYRRPPRTTC